MDCTLGKLLEKIHVFVKGDTDILLEYTNKANLKKHLNFADATWLPGYELLLFMPNGYWSKPGANPIHLIMTLRGSL